MWLTAEEEAGYACAEGEEVDEEGWGGGWRGIFVVGAGVMAVVGAVVIVVPMVVVRNIAVAIVRAVPQGRRPARD